MTLCKCGCGQETKPGNSYINGHNWKGKHPKGYWYGKHHSAETRQKLSIANMDHPVSEETLVKMSQSQMGPKSSCFIDGRYSILEKHHDHKKEECIFGCTDCNYDLHHEPPIDDILTWTGRLVNLCRSCHMRIHLSSLKLPKDVGVLWTKEDTAKLIVIE